MTQTKERREKFCNLTVEVKREFNDEIISHARKEDISKSELIRRAIKEYISR